MTQSHHRSRKRLSYFAAGASLLALMSQVAHAQTITNPSFEANSFTVAPGYISDNSDINGWTADVPGGAGLNPAGGQSTFADNGAIPDGKNVAFITGGTTLSTKVTGLTAGKAYRLTLQVNSSTNQTSPPIFRANVDGTDILSVAIYSVGETAPYEYVAFEFTAGAANATLAFTNDGPVEGALLIDNLKVAASTGSWVVEAWTDDATSGVDSAYVYTHAYSFGSSANTVINGVLFTGVAGANPSVAGKFTSGHMGNVFNNDANNVTGGSAILARDFIYSGANVSSGTYESINLEGLTPGADYVATIYSVAFDGPSPTIRWATFSLGEDRLTVNQDQFDNNNGIRIACRYKADTAGKATLNIAPINPVNVSVHVYGFSNREAVSRNLAPSIAVQPVGTTVAQGLPVLLTVSAGGFPTPTYQWRFNGSNIAGATSATNAIAQASTQNAGSYDVIVSNSLGAVTSVVASVVVGLPMTNPSFEADTFQSWPGYSGDNPGSANTPAGPNTPITGWTQSSLEGSGINPVVDGTSPFADNGQIPNGRQVAFVQADSTLSQTVTGLTAGAQYYVHYYENARGGNSPALELQLNGVTAVPTHTLSSGGYKEVYSDVFTASSTSLELSFVKSNPFGGDNTALIDNVAVVPVAAGTAPFVTKAPSSVAAYVGDSVTFSAQVLGSLPLSYQWLKNGAPVAGATNPTLTLTNVQKAAEGDYALQVTNGGGSVTTALANLKINEPVPGLFNTGVDNNRVALADNEIDPHYRLIENPDTSLPDAIVEDSTVFPISDGTWLRNTAVSKWIGPQLNTSASAVGLYTYRTTVNLTGYDPQSVAILGRWAVDNAGRDIRVNGVSTRNPESPGFNSWTSFAIYGTNTTFTAGTNTIDFIVENVDAVGYTGLRVEIVESNVLRPGSGAGPRLQITLAGNSITITWTPTAAGQKLQSAADVTGPWTEVTGATSPFTTAVSGPRKFYRVAQ